MKKDSYVASSYKTDLRRASCHGGRTEEAVEVTLTVAAHVLQTKAERVRRTPTFHVDQLDCPDFTRLMQKPVPVDAEHMAAFMAKLDGGPSLIPRHMKFDVPDMEDVA
ncbi:hypothetical protein RUM4293_03382 [Ruegeria atlantica]|uniref:Uncharacterized protein n=1 Tax=Ruegeria atlantica TaxID=81569 RepID=A0A0P1E742_9RHOB|nr:hypothetical protein RUM4293_03382 [Ruegeria atlantica]